MGGVITNGKGNIELAFARTIGDADVLVAEMYGHL